MKKKKIKKIIIIMILLFVILLPFFAFNKTEETEKKPDNKKEVMIDQKWDTPNGANGKLYVYSNDDVIVGINELEENYVKNDSSYKVIASYDCNLTDCKAYGSYKNKDYIVIKDDNYYIYDYKKNKALELNFPKALYNSVEFLGYENEVYGLCVSNINDLSAYYSIKKEKFITEFKYSVINTYESALFANGKFISNIFNDSLHKYYVVDMESGKELFESDNVITAFGNKKYVYYSKPTLDSYYSNAQILNDEYKLINNNFYSLYAVSKDGNLAVLNEDNTFSLYNKNGKVIKTSKSYKRIGNIFNDYVSVEDNDNYLKLIDYDGNVVARFIKLEENYYFHPELSYLEYKNSENIIYLCVENTNIEYGQKGNGLLYSFNLNTKEKKVFELESVY